ncbi:hypothetical protein F4824DRAFT_510088 [Ustulina deusta]|nr:hypothetical protein F4824DRAFT_510088 [Ustulina deusta]
MDSLSQPTSRLAKECKRVHFKRDSILEDVQIIEPRQQHHHRRQERQHRSQQQESTLRQGGTLSHNIPEGTNKVRNLDGVPPLFRCKSYMEIRNIISAGKGTVADIFRGYNALHWYCNAKSTSPGIIQQLLSLGIDIDALDQRTHTRGRPVIRHTALGYACRNANVKAIHTLLRNGADPSGLTKLDLPKKDIHGSPIVYPSPLQELLCQPIHGPRPGKCPWTYHLSEEDEEKDGYLDENDPESLPEFRALTRLSDLPPEKQPLCQSCAADFHIWEPWPKTEEERTAARKRRQSCYYGQIVRLGNRLKTCVQLLLNYNCSDPPVFLPGCDDPHLWSGVDYFLETFWRFFYPLAICGDGLGRFSTGDFLASPGQLTRVISQTIFAPFGEIADMLVESAGYEGEGRDIQGEARGSNRLISLIAAHPEFTSFRQGEYFDVDAQLDEARLESSTSS